ncbi:DUF6057 family protein [Bacteroides oleiciplenus]|uniref:DUF6057 family protein n=1 Tax=Bacteroides oleiciplenus TaxID=626931 RepID=UPI0026DC2F57|nr:DUF6057 family protein [Bacteroides oleiciplenus]
MKKQTDIILVFLFFIACWIFFFWLYPYHLYYKEQITLCVLQPDFLQTYLQKPAFLTEICGDYLTQFFLWTGGGGSILTLTFLLTWSGLRIALARTGITRHTSLWALLPIIAEWGLSCHLEYPLSMSLGLLFSVWAFTLTTLSTSARTRGILHTIMLILLYCTIGAHFLAYALLAIAHECKHSNSALFPLFLLIISILIPIGGSHFYYLTPRQSYFYPLISNYMLRQPFAFLLTEIFLLFSILPAFVSRLDRRWIAFPAILILSAATLSKAYNASEEKTLAFSSEAYFGHWDKVLQLNKDNVHPTYLSAYYTNLAYARQGKLCDELMQHYQPASYGLLLQINESTGYIYSMASPDALMECGDMAQAQHSAMLAMTFTPHQRSSRMMRRLAEIAIINKDYAVACKYLRMLSHTSLHRKWAEERLEIINSGQCDSIPYWIHKRRMLPQQDTLFSANQWRASLTNLIKNNPQNKVAADYLLCFHLLNKDLEHFKKDYDCYYYPTFGLLPPRLYQEALIACMDEKANPQEQLKHYRISAQVYKDCLEYLSIHEEAQGDGRALEKKFGKTYWFYYYYAQLKP